MNPEKTGSVFGSDDFYDYVIVEGSKNFGKTWFRLADGYDSRFLKHGKQHIIIQLIGMNSTAVGNESMLNKHTIFYSPSDNISAGDTLLIRFRLFSDPFANGWGWVIEDLKINPLVDAVENVNSDIPCNVYPNPGNGLIRIRSDESGADSGKPIQLQYI